MRRGHKSAAVSAFEATAHRGYLIQPRVDSGYSITKGGHVIQHQTPTIESAKAIVDTLCE